MNKLQGKDLINVGIFTAIYFVVMMANGKKTATGKLVVTD